MTLESLYTELYEALTGNAPLMAKVTGVFDGLAPESQGGPFVVMGELQELPGRTMDEEERKCLVTLHVWSDYRGRKELFQVAELLDKAVPEECLFEELQVLRDADGWWHGIATYRTYRGR
jgi:hypothetical protein